jgi:hypothetical protein
MNGILISVFGIVVAILVLVCFKVFNKILSERMRSKFGAIFIKLKIMTASAVHETFINAAIPMQVTALLTIAQSDLPTSKYIAPWIVIISFIIYPVAVYLFVSYNVDKLISKDEETLVFRKMLRTVYSDLSLLGTGKRLRFILYSNYRRLCFSLILVVLSKL